MSHAIEQGREIILHAETLQAALRSLSMLASELSGGDTGYILVDPTHTHIAQAVFPSLPRLFEESVIDIPLAFPYIGTCVAAICTGKPVTCTDILADTQFDHDWRDTCLRCDIRSVRSKPVKNAETQTAEGTFVVAFKEASDATRWDDALMSDFAGLAAEAIKLYRRLAVRVASPS